MAETQTSDLHPVLIAPEVAETEFDIFWEKFAPYTGFAAPDHIGPSIDQNTIPLANQVLLKEMETKKLTSDIFAISIATHPDPSIGLRSIPTQTENNGSLFITVPLQKFIKWTSTLTPENLISGKPVLDQSDISKIRMLFEVTTAINGGSDAYKTAQVLTAVTVLDAMEKNGKGKHITGNLDKRLRKQFAISESITKLRVNLQLIDNLILNYSAENRTKLQDIFLHDTQLFLIYAVNKITDYSLISPENMTESDFRNLETLRNAFREVNLSSIPVTDTELEANINDSMVYLQELWIARKYSYAYALGNEVVSRKTGLPHHLRFNSALTKRLFDRLLDEAGVVDKDDRSFRLTGNMKSASSLLLEVLSRNPTFRDRITSLSRNLGILGKKQSAYPEKVTPMKQTIISLEDLDTILMMADTMPGNEVARVISLSNDLISAMDAKEYFIRCRAITNDPVKLLKAVYSAAELTDTYPTDSNIITQGLAVINTDQGGWSQMFSIEELLNIYKDERAPLFFLLDSVRQIPDGGSGYGSIFVWLPARLDLLKGKMELYTPDELQHLSPENRKNITWIEAQFTIPELISASNLNRLLWEKRVYKATDIFPQELMDVFWNTKNRILENDSRSESDKNKLPVNITPE